MEEIHIGEEIKKIFISSGLTAAEFSRRINVTRANVYNIFERKTVDTGLLLLISYVLQFDFFSLYVRKINPIEDSEIDRLRKEVEYLKEINSLLKSKTKLSGNK